MLLGPPKAQKAGGSLWRALIASSGARGLHGAGILLKVEPEISSSSAGLSLAIHGGLAITGISVARYFCAPLIFS